MKTLIVNIFWDIIFVYKNIIHFLISKILIALSILVYIFLFLFPIFLIFWIIFYFLGFFDWNFNPYVFLGNYYYMWFWISFVLLLFLVYWISYSWGQILLTRLAFGYVNREKLPFSKNYYFNKELFFVFFKIFFLLLLITSIPFLIWILGFFIIILIFWGLSNSLEVVNTWISNPLSVWLLILTVISLIIFIYLVYKTIFTYVILIDKYSRWKNLKNWFYYIKKSFKFTKGIKRFFKLLLITFLVWIITFPVYFFEDYFSNKANEVKNYLYYSLIYSSWKDLWDFSVDYEKLKLNYSNYSIEELNFMIKKYNYLTILFYILEFVFIWGIYNLVLISFYKTEKNNSK